MFLGQKCKPGEPLGVQTWVGSNQELCCDGKVQGNSRYEDGICNFILHTEMDTCILERT